jgi:hypothetical protein
MSMNHYQADAGNQSKPVRIPITWFSFEIFPILVLPVQAGKNQAGAVPPSRYIMFDGQPFDHGSPYPPINQN